LMPRTNFTVVRSTRSFAFNGLEWMAVFPFGFVFLGLVVPALLLGAIAKLLRFGALLASAGLAVNLLVFLEIVREMTSHAAHHLKF
jgi:hypothetical protein